METKTCRKCSRVFPADLDHFYKNSGGKYGLTPRCKACANEDNEASHAKRLATQPDRVRAQARARSKRSYYRHLESNRARQRDHHAKRRADPGIRQEIAARKRGGGARLSAAQIAEIAERQHHRCAICDAPGPTDLDHCHKTGRVRFLLCRHCNRGLGAFFDSPNLMRRAARVLEQSWEE